VSLIAAAAIAILGVVAGRTPQIAMEAAE